LIDLVDDERRDRAIDLLTKAVARSKRTKGVPFSPAFIRATTGGRPPLSQLIYDGGGQGGGVRLRLYMSLKMMASHAPYDVKTPPTPRQWARRFALPEDNGARRVNNALKWLEAHKLIKLEQRVGAPSGITLLSSSGNGSRYVEREGGRWVSMPLEFWTHGWILDLQPTSIALLLILMELQGGRGERHQPASQERRHEYGLSSSAWTVATNALKSYGLLTVKRITQSEEEFVYDRMRNAYHVDVDRLRLPPPSATR
jgi:hypothetical protein